MNNNNDRDIEMANEMDSDEDEFRGRQGRPNQRAIADKENDAVSELGDNSVSIITTVLTQGVKWTKSYPSQDSEEEDSLPDKKKKATSALFGNSDTEVLFSFPFHAAFVHM